MDISLRGVINHASRSLNKAVRRYMKIWISSLILGLLFFVWMLAAYGLLFDILWFPISVGAKIDICQSVLPGSVCEPTKFFAVWISEMLIILSGVVTFAGMLVLAESTKMKLDFKMGVVAASYFVIYMGFIFYQSGSLHPDRTSYMFSAVTALLHVAVLYISYLLMGRLTSKGKPTRKVRARLI